MISSAAQGRAHVRLIAENQERFRRLFVDAPNEMSRQRRRNWAITQLTHEYPERYKEIYAEEKEKFPSGDPRRSIDPTVVGKASGPGPWHAVLAEGFTTLCGRTRLTTYPADASRQVDCSYCIDMLRDKPGRTVDPKFREHVAVAEARAREFVDLQARAIAARGATAEALSALRTPPKGTAERAMLAGLIGELRARDWTLEEIGTAMNLSRERIRQIADEAIEPGSAS